MTHGVPAVFEPPSTNHAIGRLVIDRADDPVNAVNPELIEALAAAIRAARAQPGLRGLLITSAKPTQWVAGADLRMITRAADAAALEAISRRFQAVLDELAWLPCTTVAAINGPALGGGLELALACDYRVVADLPTVTIGQPEVSLGLIPGGGGTQRLPRLVGLQRGLDLILSGRRLDARRARRAGVVDEVVHPTVLAEAGRTWAARPKRPLDRPLRVGLSVQAAIDVAELTPTGRALMYRQARAAVLARTGGHYPAPLRALEAIEIGFEEGMAAGLVAEARAFGELAESSAAHHLIWLFLATQRQRRHPSRDPGSSGGQRPARSERTQVEPPTVDVSAAERQGMPTGEPAASPAANGGAAAEVPESPGLHEIERGPARSDPPLAGGLSTADGGRVFDEAVGRVGVVGAGFMGAAIAEVVAAAGLEVRLRDVSVDAVARGLATIRRLVDSGVRRRRFDAHDGARIVQRVSGTTDYTGFARTDLVIEAVVESLPVKQQVVTELDAVLAPTAVIASNTSALPIADIARGSAHPERVVGMHFFSPAERMPLLEVIRPTGAQAAAVAVAVDLGTRLGKTVIVVGDTPGFYTTRVLGVMLNEAALLLAEGADLATVDRALTDFGFPVGPFVLYDEVGLAVAQHVGETVARAFGERLPISDLVPRLVAAGQTGRKAGAGFYRWPKRSRVGAWLRRPTRVPNPAVAGLLPARRVAAPARVQDRLVLLFVNEAIRCLDEGVLRSPTDGDLGAVLGLGFPPFLGGPFHYADAQGHQVLVDRLAQLAAEHGQRYTPAGGLVERARSGRAFFEE